MLKDPARTVRFVLVTAAASAAVLAGASLANAVTGTENIFTVAGTGTAGSSGDNGPAVSAQISDPHGLAIAANGSYYIADTGNNRIRRVGNGGNITRFAGSTQGFSGDNGQALSAQLNQPNDVAIDSTGNVFIADTGNNRIRKVDTAGVITTVAGDGTAGSLGDNGPATSAQLNQPSGIAVDGSDNLYVADTENNRIRRIDSAGTITVVAGSGTAGFGGDEGPALTALLNKPRDVIVTSDNGFIIADTDNNRIREVNSSGDINTIAGDGNAGFSGDAAAATAAQLNHPNAISQDTTGNVYIADTDNNRIRRVDLDGIITTIAGTGTSGFSGDNGVATSAQINHPRGVASNTEGTLLYVSDSGNNRIRRIGGNAPATPTPSASATTASPTASATTASPSASATTTSPTASATTANTTAAQPLAQASTKAAVATTEKLPVTGIAPITRLLASVGLAALCIGLMIVYVAMPSRYPRKH